MNKKKILVLSTYPIKNPQHGGQKRTYAIVDAYRQHFAQVRHSAVFFRPFYAEHEADDIPLGRDSEHKVMSSPLTGDVVCGEAIFEDGVVKRKMTSLLRSFAPDIIHIEQPFPYLGLKPLLKELQLSPRLVFGSQNIEAPMKREILEGAHVEEAQIRQAEKLITDLEAELSRASDLVVACTPSDLEAHKRMGAKHVVLAPNGVSRPHIDPQAVRYWQDKFQDMGVNRKILFVGSAHPPNWTGFLQMVGKGLGFLPYDARIIAAGSISDYFEREVNADAPDIDDATFWLRAFATGRLSEDRLAALITLGDVILLPITEGGGSNLKTAEAILADKKVVATSHALRSFEWFKDFPNVWVADTKPTFIRSIQAALDASHAARSAQQAKLAHQVEWQQCLKAMVDRVGAL
ncbi:MAG: glycosyltransferase [Candidatus Saccharibacteria bacterium]